MSQNPKPTYQVCVDLVSAGEEDIEIENVEEETPRPVGRSSGAVTVGQARRRMMRHYLEFQEAIAPRAPVKPRRIRAPSPPPRPRKKIYRVIDLVDPDNE